MKEVKETGKERYLEQGQVIGGTGWFRHGSAEARGLGLAHLQILPTDVWIRIDRIKRTLHARASSLCVNGGEAILGLKREKRRLITVKVTGKPTRIA
jgi:hypothetical protein